MQALRQAAVPKREPKPAIELAPPPPLPPLPLDQRINALERRAYDLDAELRQVCQEAGYGCERQTIRRLARDLRQRMYDLEVLAA